MLASGVRSENGPRRIFIVLAYNIGRITSYTLAGAIAGGIGQTVFNLLGQQTAHAIAGVISALFLIALGTYLAGWWSYLLILERAGAKLWRYIEPWGRHLLPVRSVPQALLLGGLWGWLPCGLVYTVLVWAMASGSVVSGAWLMGAFGLGTLPTLLVLGGLGRKLQRLRQEGWVRPLAAGIVILLGVYGLWATLSGHESVHMH